MGQCGSSNKTIVKDPSPQPLEETNEISMKKLLENVNKKIDKLGKPIDGHPCIVQVNMIFYVMLFLSLSFYFFVNENVSVNVILMFSLCLFVGIPLPLL